jgi:hypothetical protein
MSGAPYWHWLRLNSPDGVWQPSEATQKQSFRGFVWGVANALTGGTNLKGDELKTESLSQIIITFLACIPVFRLPLCPPGRRAAAIGRAAC